MDKMTIELTQAEANMLLRGLEELQSSSLDGTKAKKLWSKIFDTGLKAGFGKGTHNDQ